MSLIVLGAGGHAGVLIDALQASGKKIIGITDPNPETHGKVFFGLPVLGTDDEVLKYKTNEVVLVNGVGSIQTDFRRKEIFERFAESGYAFDSVVHPSSVIGAGVKIFDGAQIMAGTILQTECSIGKNTIINTRAAVDHNCVIGSHVHIAPGAILGGAVFVGDSAHIGTGAVVLQNIQVGDGALIAAGATVISDVDPGGRVAGIPAKYMR